MIFPYSIGLLPNRLPIQKPLNLNRNSILSVHNVETVYPGPLRTILLPTSGSHCSSAFWFLHFTWTFFSFLSHSFHMVSVSVLLYNELITPDLFISTVCTSNTSWSHKMYKRENSRNSIDEHGLFYSHYWRSNSK